MTFLWLEGLESALPGQTSEEPTATKSKTEKADQPKQKKLNVKNTVAKIVIDQVIGGAWATVLFSLTMGLLRGQEYDVLVDQIRNVRKIRNHLWLGWDMIADLRWLKQDFWPLLIAGFKLWPLVSILNFTVVPADKRLLVGSIFGVVWAVYLSLMSG